MWRNRLLPSGILGAAIRFVALGAGVSALVLAVAVPVGLATGAGLHRTTSLGFYLVGAFVVVLGLATGSRGPYRSTEDGATITVARNLRRATLDELLETINLSVLVVAVGLMLLALGVVIDDRYRLI